MVELRILDLEALQLILVRNWDILYGVYRIITSDFIRLRCQIQKGFSKAQPQVQQQRIIGQ